MPATHIFDIPASVTNAACLGRVVAVDDPEGLGRVQVRVLSHDGVDDHDAEIWARVAVPFAGPERGAFFLPDVDDEVLIAFVAGDPRLPIVVGGLWNGEQKPPEQLGGSGTRVDRWTFVGKAGTRIAIVEETPGNAIISLTTPDGGGSIVIEQGSGGKITMKAAGATVAVDTAGASVETPAKVSVKASQVSIEAGMVTVDAAFSKFSGIVQCDTLISNTVVSAAYTPGAGNIW
jgi:uncharacterized protein involved in type VI secretion and phage assembly